MVTKRTTAKKTRKPASPRRSGEKSKSLDPTLWSDVEAIGRRVPTEDRAKMPRDAAARFDEYIEDMRL